MSKSDRVDGYSHTNAWWQDNQGSLERTSPEGEEYEEFSDKEPTDWGVNLLIKVIKYSNFELLERYEDEWDVLDQLIAKREDIVKKSSNRKIPQNDAEKLLNEVRTLLRKIGQDVKGEIDTLKSSTLPLMLF